MKTPSALTLVCVCFCAGILAADAFHVPLAVAAGLSALFAVLAIVFSRFRAGGVLILLASFFLGAASLINSDILPEDHIIHLTRRGGGPVTIEGLVSKDPEPREKSTYFVLDAERVKIDGKYIPVSGKVLVSDFTKSAINYGERWMFEGKLYRPPYFYISDKLNYREYLARKGIYAALSINKTSARMLIASHQGNPLKERIYLIRKRAAAVVDANMEPFAAGVINAIILGYSNRVPDGLRDALVRTGTVHIIAISGMNLAIIGYIVFMLFTIARIPKKWGAVLTLLLLIAYSIMTGANTPVVRAAIMSFTVLFSFMIGRKTDIYHSLSFAALAILLVNPQQIFDISFQLSFISIIVIVAVTPYVEALFPERMKRGGAVHELVKLFSSSAAAFVGLSPLIAYYFNVVSFIAVIANMIVVPWMSFMTYVSLMFIGTGLIGSALTKIFAAATEFSVVFLVATVKLFERFPFGYLYTTPFSLMALLGIYLLLFCIFIFAHKKMKI